jgi:hypothetical protein
MIEASEVLSDDRASRTSADLPTATFPLDKDVTVGQHWPKSSLYVAGRILRLNTPN